MKKTLALALILVTLCVAATPALAQDTTGVRPTPSANRPFDLIGQVTAVDTAAGTLDVIVLLGNAAVRDKIGREITIQTNRSTVIRRLGTTAAEAVITLGDIEVGEHVAVQGGIVNSNYVARQIIVGVPYGAPAQTPFHLIGQVKAVDTAAGALTVKVLRGNRAVRDKVGQELTIATNARTIIRRFGATPGETITLGDIAVGQYVSVAGGALNNVFTARLIVVGVPHNDPPKTPFHLIGSVTAVDTAAATLSVSVLRGEGAAAGKVGQVLTITVDATTIIYHYHDEPRVPEPRVPLTLADVSVGQIVSVAGNFSEEVYLANLIVTDFPFPPFPRPTLTPRPTQTPRPTATPRPERFQMIGTVTAVDTAAKTFKATVLRATPPLHDKIGQEIVIQTTNATRFMRFGGRPIATPITLDDLRAGQIVSVTGRVVEGVYTADLVVVGVPRTQPLD
jgi:hypothetical protein